MNKQKISKFSIEKDMLSLQEILYCVLWFEDVKRQQSIWKMTKRAHNPYETEVTNNNYFNYYPMQIFYVQQIWLQQMCQSLSKIIRVSVIPQKYRTDTEKMSTKTIFEFLRFPKLIGRGIFIYSVCTLHENNHRASGERTCRA